MYYVFAGQLSILSVMLLLQTWDLIYNHICHENVYAMCAIVLVKYLMMKVSTILNDQMILG